MDYYFIGLDRLTYFEQGLPWRQNAGNTALALRADGIDRQPGFDQEGG